MKKIIVIMLSVLILTFGMTACGNPEEGNDTVNYDTDTISVVTTIFPEYDWVKAISNGAENIEITMLMDGGVDLHSFQPTANDIIEIMESDLFIYVGGESDEWVEDALAQSENHEGTVLNLMELLGNRLKEEELVEGMEAEEEGEDEEEEGPEYDEHVWLSLKNAEVIVNEIANALSEINPADSEIFAKNLADYTEKLKILDEEYESSISSGTKDTLVFADRFPFRYLTDDYGLNYFAAFNGCSAESEASFETIVFLAKKLDELKLNKVMTIEGSDGKIAQTVIQNTASDQMEILVMDSLQSITSNDVENGISYLEIMKNNLEMIKKALE